MEYTISSFINFMHNNGWEAIVDFNDDPIDCIGKSALDVAEVITSMECCYVKWISMTGKPTGWSFIIPSAAGEDFLCNYRDDDYSGDDQDKYLELIAEEQLKG